MIMISENKKITQFINTAIPAECIIRADVSRTFKSLNISGKTFELHESDTSISHIQSLDHVLSNIKSKIKGTFHGISLEFLENELADFEWKFNRRKRNLENRLKSLIKTIINGSHQTDMI